ncbi:MAG: MOSC domain-containing protein [Rhodobacteraceae bacterium]|nr:MOSC domain-containing protein [Paracoccaceae bacterium]
MTGCIAQIWRHPIKAHGREELSEVALSAGKCLPMDRQWAVAHERSCFDAARPRWQPCSEFSRGAKSPRLQAMTARHDAYLGKLTFSHPDLRDLTVDPDDEGDANRFIQWVMPVSNGARTLPARLVRGSQAMTDTDFASVSVINLASHRAVADMAGQPLSPLRWRGNLLVDGWESWAEAGLIGRRIRIGEAELDIREQITRCRMTEANPETGARDVDILAALRSGFGHQEMGIYAVVSKGGLIRQGDKIEVL